MGFDEADAGGEEVEAHGVEAYNCPFCGEDFDFVGLCCHIDYDHVVEAKSGVCHRARSDDTCSCHVVFVIGWVGLWFEAI